MRGYFFLDAFHVHDKGHVTNTYTVNDKTLVGLKLGELVSESVWWIKVW